MAHLIETCKQHVVFIILTTSFIRNIKTKSMMSHVVVENRGANGKVYQRFTRYIDKGINAIPVRRISTNGLYIMAMRLSLDAEVVHRMSMNLELNGLFPRNALVSLYSPLLKNSVLNRMGQYLKNTEIFHFIGIPAINTTVIYDAPI